MSLAQESLDLVTEALKLSDTVTKRLDVLIAQAQQSTAFVNQLINLYQTDPVRYRPMFELVKEHVTTRTPLSQS